MRNRIWKIEFYQKNVLLPVRPVRGGKVKKLKMKILETMADKTRFEMEVPTKETRDERNFKAHNPSFGEGNFTSASNYHLALGCG